jgi:hypothetical protein
VLRPIDSRELARVTGGVWWTNFLAKWRRGSASTPEVPRYIGWRSEQQVIDEALAHQKDGLVLPHRLRQMLNDVRMPIPKEVHF